MGTTYPAGRYRLKTLGAALGESKSGNPQIEINVEILGYHDPEGGFRECSGDRTVYLSLTDATLGTPSDPGWVYQTLLDLGWDGRSFVELDSLAGHVRDGDCKHDEWDGKTVEKWGIYRRRIAQPQRPAQNQTVRQLNARFSGLLKAAAAQHRVASTTREEVAGAVEEAAEAPQAQRRNARPVKQAAADGEGY